MSRKKPLILGLTGSIGMGKSTVAKLFTKMGIPVYEADKAVHSLMVKGGAAIRAIRKIHPDVIIGGAVDRKKLGQKIFNNKTARKKLEALLYPLIQKIEKKFVAEAAAAGAPIVVLDIPLLFETGADRRVDITLCVRAPYAVQRARVLARSGMTQAKFRAIRALQMPDKEKYRRADFILDTDGTLAETKSEMRHLLRQIKAGA
jgi:dephospho-CoA kinase